MLNNLDEIPIVEDINHHNRELVKEDIMASEFFQSENYKIPKQPSNYMKFEDGLNRFRVLSSAIVGFQYFTNDNKPVRSKEPFEDTPVDIKKDGKVKHFWAFVVWNYNDKRVQILEITQNTIMKPMKALIDNSKWGNPKNYDIAITKTGEGLDTEYNVQGEPPIGEPESEITNAYAKTNINLEALFNGTDPFKN